MTSVLKRNHDIAVKRNHDIAVFSANAKEIALTKNNSLDKRNRTQAKHCHRLVCDFAFCDLSANHKTKRWPYIIAINS